MSEASVGGMIVRGAIDQSEIDEANREPEKKTPKPSKPSKLPNYIPASDLAAKVAKRQKALEHGMARPKGVTGTGR